MHHGVLPKPTDCIGDTGIPLTNKYSGTTKDIRIWVLMRCKDAHYTKLRAQAALVYMHTTVKITQHYKSFA